MSALSSLDLVFYAAVLLSAFAVRSAAGFGAGLIAIPMLAFVLPVSTAVSIATVFTTLSSIQQISREWRQIAWRQFMTIFFYSMVGVGLGLYFIKLLNEDLMRCLLGIFMVLYSIHALRATDTSRFLPKQWHGVLGAGVGIVGGLLSALFGAGAGPVYVVYFDILRLEKAVFRATMSAVVVLGGVARIVGYGTYGFYGPSTVALLALGIPVVIIGSWLGDRIVYRLSARSFSRFVAAIILLSGITLLVR
ncbi:MAG TPA: sulfite exporter TauE/SafE family protein [Stellaceae bacterium]|jgi:hypothetical protein|nr:sulfite exporter TauE/SafE family protein [Stellaceae bacterium]